MNDCFESIRLIQRYYNRTGIFQMDYSITYKLAFSPDRSCYISFMLRGLLYIGKILAPNLTSQTSLKCLSVIQYKNYTNKQKWRICWPRANKTGNKQPHFCTAFQMTIFNEQPELTAFHISPPLEKSSKAFRFSVLPQSSKV